MFAGRPEGQRLPSPSYGSLTASKAAEGETSRRQVDLLATDVDLPGIADDHRGQPAQLP